jgi:hypothetical protein
MILVSIQNIFMPDVLGIIQKNKKKNKNKNKMGRHNYGQIWGVFLGGFSVDKFLCCDFD